MKFCSAVAICSLSIGALKAQPGVRADQSSGASPRAQQRQFEFKGLRLRDSLTNELVRAHSFDCKDDPDRGEGIETCSSWSSELANVPVMLYVDLVDRKLAVFTFAFEPKTFASIVDAFRTQWGAPASLTSDKVQNPMGATFDNVVAKWRFADGTLEVVRYGGRLTTSTASIADLRLSAAIQRRRDCAKAQAMVRDFSTSSKLPAGCAPRLADDSSRDRGVNGAVTVENQTYFDYQVDKPVMSVPGSPSPHYPDSLKSAGIEGEVDVSFVVDTTGRVDISTLTILKTTHELFTAAVRAALPNMRFLSAEVGGKKVRQLVQMPFVFNKIDK